MKVVEATREKKDKVNCKLQEKQKAIQGWEGHHSTPLWPGCKEHLCDLDCETLVMNLTDSSKTAMLESMLGKRGLG